MSESETFVNVGIERIETTEHHVTIPLTAQPVAPFGEEGDSMFTNLEMESMLNTLSTLLGRSDLIGYAAARNTRILNAEAQEYMALREQLIMKYGKPQVDEDGNETGVYELKFDAPEFRKYEEEIASWANVKHSPNIFKIPPEEVIGKLSGNEILSIEWMLDWQQD